MTHQEAEVTLRVNSKEARQKLEELETQAAELRKKFAQAFKDGDTRAVDKINRELSKVNKEMNSMRTNAANIRAAMTRLDRATPKELQRTIKLVNAELNSGRVVRGSKEWDSYIAKLRQTQAELKKVKAEISGDGGAGGGGWMDSVRSKLGGWATAAAGAAAAIAGLALSGRKAVETFAAMQAEEANVRKYTGMTADEVSRLNDQFKTLDTRTSREDLNRLAQEAGRLGKTSVEDVMGFVRAADKINVALDDLGEGATLTLSKLTGIFGDEAVYGTEQSLLKVGSVINELSQNCSASAPYLAEFSSRLGGIAAQSKMTVSQIMSFAAVLDTNNLAVEASSTALGQLITKIYQGPAEIAKAAQLDVKKFSDMVKTDMNGALVMLFEHLNKFGGMETLATVFDEMGTDGARAIPVLAALSGHVEELKSQQLAANKAFAEGTSVTEEFNVQNETVQARLDKAQKGFTEVAVSLGEKLLPVMEGCISGTTMLLKVITGIVSFITGHFTTIASLTAAVVAYTVAINANVIAQKAQTAAMMSGNILAKTVNATTMLLTAGMNLLTGNVGKATVAWRAFNIAVKSNPIALAVSVLAAGVTAITSWIAKNNEAAKEEKRIAEERKKEQEGFKRGLTDLSEGSARYASGEIQRLDSLYKAATNVNKSYEARQKAAKQLQATYPNTFSNLSTEAIMAGEAADAYLRLAKNIKEVVRAEAARDKMKANEDLKISLELENEDLADEIGELEAREDRLLKMIDGLRSAAKGSADKAKQLQTAKKMLAETEDKLAQKDLERATNNDKMATVNKSQEKLTDIVEKSTKAMEEFGEKSANALSYTKPIDPKEAATAARKAAKEKKDALKQDLDDQKALYLQAQAENEVMLYTGQRDYKEYLAKKEALEIENADRVIAIHKDHNELDKVAYAKALKDRADLDKKAAEEKRKLSLKEIEADHSDTENLLVSNFYNPDSSIFQNEKQLNQMLFQEHIRYLEEKKALYMEGEEAWEAIEQEINDRVAQYQLDRQKETAQALMQFETEYRKGSGSRRVQMELATLKDLYDKRLISEEEYQKALRDIKTKARNEDQEEARELSNDYSDMALNLYNSFSDLFDNLGKEGSDFWKDLGKAAEAAFAVMGAALSQYSAYANAERDLELARVESRYDREIEQVKATEKNKKKLEEKTAKLEKQKEAEMAKIKSKANEKAMKIEVAQAVASTALAAINAYASASKVNWVLGPIAAAMATAAGAIQIATIKKQHEAEAIGYYSGGFTDRDPDNRREVGVVHANEFVANHEAVANPALAPVLRLIDHAQRNNTIGSLTAADVSQAIGTARGVGQGGEMPSSADNAMTARVSDSFSLMADVSSRTAEALDRLSANLEEGIDANVIMDGERGLYRKLKRYDKLINNPKR